LLLGCWIWSSAGKASGPVKKTAGIVICLVPHMAELMPLPLTISCFSKIQSGFTFLVPAQWDGPGKMAVKRVCVLLQYLIQTVLKAD